MGQVNSVRKVWAQRSLNKTPEYPVNLRFSLLSSREVGTSFALRVMSTTSHDFSNFDRIFRSLRPEMVFGWNGTSCPLGLPF